MRLKEPIDPNIPGGDRPVPIPPVEDAWTAMRKRLDLEMPVGRKRRRAFWLFFLLLPLLLWWWIERGQGRGAGPAQESHVHATGSTHGETQQLSGTKATAHSTNVATVSGSPPIAVSKTDSAHHRSIRQPGVSSVIPDSRSGQSVDRSAHELKAVSIDVQRATWDRSIILDAPPLDPRHKAAANAKPPKRQPAALETPKKPQDRILFAAGLADNKSFPVGAQQVVDYNANLKKDIWFDYVPTPYFQYHPSRKFAFQFGVQFVSPQYTENVTIFRKAGPQVGPGSLFTQDTAIVVRKLYYFNSPLTIYYSPVRNIQLGIGIQYSNLRNGVALQNNVIHYTGGGAGQRDTVTTSKFVTLKDNATAYNNLKKSDWRGLLELNYYWRKITLGLQYQESLGDYLRTPVEGSQGRNRNSSFNLYLRYNIWEKRVVVPPRK